MTELYGHPSKWENGKPTKKQQIAINRDKAVTNYLTKAGYRVLRFWDFEILDNISDCIAQITRRSNFNDWENREGNLK